MTRRKTPTTTKKTAKKTKKTAATLKKATRAQAKKKTSKRKAARVASKPKKTTQKKKKRSTATSTATKKPAVKKSSPIPAQQRKPVSSIRQVSPTEDKSVPARETVLLNLEQASAETTFKPKKAAAGIYTEKHTQHTAPVILLLIGLGLGAIGIFGSACKSFFYTPSPQQTINEQSVQSNTEVTTYALKESSGFPVQLNTFAYAAATVADLNRDGAKEIIQTTSGGCIYVLTSDGAPFGGAEVHAQVQTEPACTKASPTDPWPIQIVSANAGVIGTPQVAQLDDDLELEFVVGVQDTLTSEDTITRIYAMNDDGTLVWDTPIACSGFCLTPDILDVGYDGVDEIAFASFSDSDDTSSLTIVDGDGQTLPGWPQVVPGRLQGVVAADTDSNGVMEIYATDGAQIFAFSETGSQIFGWPQSGGFVAIGDVTGDDQYEIVSFTSKRVDDVQTIKEATLVIRNADGSSIPLPAWKTGSIIIGEQSQIFPQITDIDNSGKAEIIFSVEDTGQLFAYRGNGSQVYGWPQRQYASPPVSAADLNGDKRSDIISSFLVGEYTQYVAFTQDGQIMKGFPVLTTSSLYEPIVTDVDDDGKTEMIVAEVANDITSLHVYQLPSAQPLLSKK